jgi:hypothetical protein
MFRARLPSKTEDEGTFEAVKNEGQVFTPTVKTLQCCHAASLRNSPNIVNGWFLYFLFAKHVGPPEGIFQVRQWWVMPTSLLLPLLLGGICCE